MNSIDSLIIQNINDFRRDFINSSQKLFYDSQKKKFIHPGEYGVYREKICKRFLRQFIPNDFDISSGFVVNNIGLISTQCDIVIYHKETTPLISDYNNNFFFTNETVVAIGEVKSKLSKTELKKALNKLAICKQIRKNIKEPSILKQRIKMSYSPQKNHYDNIVSFLICENFSFDKSDLINEISSFYDKSIEPIYKHNMILSLNDGLFTYFTKSGRNNVTVQYPVLHNSVLKNLEITDSELYIPVKLFCSYLYNSVITSTILFPDLIQYLGSFDTQRIKYEK